VLLAAFLGWGFDGLEQGVFPLIGNRALQDLTGNVPAAVEHWFGYIMAAWLLGAAIGGFAFGWLGDKIGRVRAMGLSILVYSVFTGLGFFAQAPWQLFGLRVIAALGMGGEWALGVALVMECWPESWRPLLAGFIGAAANVGFLLIGILGYYLPAVREHDPSGISWRYFMLAGAAPAFLTFFIYFFVPESKRWIESVKHGAARPVREIFTSPRLTRSAILGIGFASVALIGTWASVQWIAKWVDALKPGQPEAKALAVAASAIGAILGCLIAPVVGGRIGRRPVYFGLCLLSFVACAALFRGFSTYNAGFLLMVVLVGGATASFYGWLPLYLPELFPTRVRATGQGLSFNSGRVFAMFAALGSGHIVSYYTLPTDAPGVGIARMCATITLVYLVGMVLIWFAPETKGKPLPE
jgi:MFS family permease